jgi:hypothetical protein
VTQVSSDTLSYPLDPIEGAPRQYRLTSRGSGYDGGSTEPITLYPIQAADYDMRRVQVPGLPFETTLYGVIRAPTEPDSGP